MFEVSSLLLEGTGGKCNTSQTGENPPFPWRQNSAQVHPNSRIAYCLIKHKQNFRFVDVDSMPGSSHYMDTGKAADVSKVRVATNDAGKCGGSY